MICQPATQHPCVISRFLSCCGETERRWSSTRPAHPGLFIQPKKNVSVWQRWSTFWKLNTNIFTLTRCYEVMKGKATLNWFPKKKKKPWENVFWIYYQFIFCSGLKSCFDHESVVHNVRSGPSSGAVMLLQQGCSQANRFYLYNYLYIIVGFFSATLRAGGTKIF